MGSLSGLTLIAFGYTLYWLMRAIGPRSNVGYRTLNRFAWPTLTNTTADELIDHSRKVDVAADAWQQVVDLSAVAHRKFEACGRAVKGFAILVLLGVAVVTTALGFTI